MSNFEPQPGITFHASDVVDLDETDGAWSGSEADARSARAAESQGRWTQQDMGKTKGPYSAEYPVGSRVRIRDGRFLTSFRDRWEHHHPLDAAMILMAGRTAVVQRVGFYHGGDELYWLDDAPGIWHEDCLEAVDAEDVGQGDGRDRPSADR